jgi:hypothetical protein
MSIYVHPGMEQVEQFVAFMTSYEIYSFIGKKSKRRVIASKVKSSTSPILEYCI